MQLLNRFWREEGGQDLIEYGFLAAFIALVCIAAITLVGTDLTAAYNTFASEILSAAAAIGS